VTHPFAALGQEATAFHPVVIGAQRTLRCSPASPDSLASRRSVTRVAWSRDAACRIG